MLGHEYIVGYVVLKKITIDQNISQILFIHHLYLVYNQYIYVNKFVAAKVFHLCWLVCSACVEAGFNKEL